MLTILFGRYSRFVRTVEAISVILVGIIIFQLIRKEGWILPDYLFAFLLVHYLFIRFCDAYPWYPGVKSRDADVPQLGIEVHFLKALVPTSYIVCLTALLYLVGAGWIATILANLMMIVVSGVNVILMMFHIRDNDPLPVNYFTRKLIISDERVMTEPCRDGHHLFQVRRDAKRERPAA